MLYDMLWYTIIWYCILLNENLIICYEIVGHDMVCDLNTILYYAMLCYTMVYVIQAYQLPIHEQL